jgi:general secretion pathway protein A
MTKIVTTVFSGFLAFFLFFSIPGPAPFASPLQKSDAQQIGEYTAAMIVAGRGVVARNQDLINDPSKGDKGFTPDFVEAEMLKDFKKITGKDMSELSPSVQAVLQQVIDAARMSVQMNQQRINKKGTAFKMYIPAVFGRETGQILKARTDINIKQTTFKYRNAYNQPDPFEKNVLKKFESADYPKGKGYGEFINGRYRYMKPIYIKQACLKCHGTPKGAKDISGHVKEGYKIGDLRGAISVSFPVH